VNSYSSSDEPPEPSARPIPGWAPFHVEHVSVADRGVTGTLEAWLRANQVIQRGRLCTLTRDRLADSGRICRELLHVLQGSEPGEGNGRERSLLAAHGFGRTQALATMFACPSGTFVELIATAPWNLLDPTDPRDPRTVRGAGSTLIRYAVEWSRRRGCYGRVALQAESPRTLRFYEHAGFRRMRPDDIPLALVPRGDLGWSPEIMRVARGCPGPAEERSPWLVRDPPELRCAVRSCA
jgi:hypothetical protein